MRRVACIVLGFALSACTFPQLQPSPAPAPASAFPKKLPKGVRYVGPGADAAIFLRARHPRLVIEVDAVAGSELKPEALRHLEDVLGSVLAKPGGIEVRTSTIRAARDSYSRADLRALEKVHRRSRTGTRVAAMYVLALNGHLAGQAHQLGIAYSASSFAIFVDQVRGSTVGRLGRIEPSVLVHEAGHLLSLVNIGHGSSRDREDRSHPNHSTNKRSVMHWAVEATSVLDLLAGGPPDDFDVADRADLEALRKGDLKVDFS